MHTNICTNAGNRTHTFTNACTHTSIQTPTHPTPQLAHDGHRLKSLDSIACMAQLSFGGLEPGIKLTYTKLRSTNVLFLLGSVRCARRLSIRVSLEVLHVHTHTPMHRGIPRLEGGHEGCGLEAKIKNS